MVSLLLATLSNNNELDLIIKRPEGATQVCVELVNEEIDYYTSSCRDVRQDAGSERFLFKNLRRGQYTIGIGVGKRDGTIEREMTHRNVAG